MYSILINLMDKSYGHTQRDGTYDYINNYLSSSDSPLSYYDSYIDLTEIEGKENRKYFLENKLTYENEIIQDKSVMIHFIGHAGSPLDVNGIPVDVIEDMNMEYIANLVHTNFCNNNRKVIINVLGSCNSYIFKKYLKGVQLLCTNSKTTDIYSPFKIKDFINIDGTIDYTKFKDSVGHNTEYNSIEC